MTGLLEASRFMPTSAPDVLLTAGNVSSTQQPGCQEVGVRQAAGIRSQIVACDGRCRFTISSLICSLHQSVRVSPSLACHLLPDDCPGLTSRWNGN